MTKAEKPSENKNRFGNESEVGVLYIADDFIKSLGDVRAKLFEVDLNKKNFALAWHHDIRCSNRSI